MQFEIFMTEIDDNTKIDRAHSQSLSVPLLVKKLCHNFLLAESFVRCKRRLWGSAAFLRRASSIWRPDDRAVFIIRLVLCALCWKIKKDAAYMQPTWGSIRLQGKRWKGVLCSGCLDSERQRKQKRTIPQQETAGFTFSGKCVCVKSILMSVGSFTWTSG